jgi:hypothetical protein
MKITKVKIYKEFKKGLPNYSNITVGMGLEFEVEEGSQPDYDKAWDIVNQQLTIQSDSLDPSWIKTEELKKDYKLTFKVKK